MAGFDYTAHQYGAVAVLSGGDRGSYPYSNTLLVRGSETTLLIDPSLALDRGGPQADLVLVSHAHEDHLAGLSGYGDVPLHAHADDLAAVRSPEIMLAGYGLPADAATDMRRTLYDDFHLHDRPDAVSFTDGAIFDLGGRTATAVHLPGHTTGHCGFLIEPDGFFFVADIDLTGFGPYYGDIGSDIDDFETSLQRCRDIDARWYGTSHQKGVIDGRRDFRTRLDAYAAVISRRDAALLDLLALPQTLDDIVDHRLVYRPHVTGGHVEPVERRTARRHLQRLIGMGLINEFDDGRFVIGRS